MASFGYGDDRHYFSGSFPTRSDAVKEGKRQHGAPGGASKIYTCENGEQPTFADLMFDAGENLLEAMEQFAADNWGNDVTDDFAPSSQATPDQIKDLDDMLSECVTAWAAKHHIDGPCFYSVSHVEEHEV